MGIKERVLMKVDRRLFLKALTFAGGGTLGFMSSPAPWHLIRDLARWTQNWPWVPVPQSGKPSLEKSICGMCDGGCGLTVRKIDKRLVRIDGNKHHPVNRGFVCPVGTAGLQMAYGPSRIQQPLKRMGDKQKAIWKPVSWKEAVEELTGKIQELRAAKESHAIGCITNNSDSSVNQLFERFLQAVGSRNFEKMNSGKDARNIVLKLMHGVDGNMAYDFENTRFILSFGCAILEGWGTCGRTYSAYSKWFAEPEGNPVQVVQVDPNLSTTAAKASQWIAIKPGTEAALALGIAHVLISDGLYDKEFVENYCFGFEDWEGADGKKHRGFKTEVLASYSPPAVEKITGATVKDIESLAHKFAVNRPALAIAGNGRGEHFADLYELMAVHSLNALVGNVNQRGGVLVKPMAPVTPLPPVVMDEEATRGYAVERFDGAGTEYPFSSYLPGNLKPEKIKVLLVHDANPRYALPEQEVAKQLFEEVPYIVSFSSYMDESSAASDLVLPIPTRFERWDDQFAAPELQYPVYNLTRPLVDSLYETRNAGDILMEIAKRLGGTIAQSFPWGNMQELLEMRARGLYEARKGIVISPEAIAMLDKGVPVSPPYSSFSEMWGKLTENNCWFDPNYEYGDPRKILKSRTGKFEFCCQQLVSAFTPTDDLKCMPHYEEQKVEQKDFNLIIMPQELLIMAKDGKGTPPFAIKQLSDDVLAQRELFVQINPITAMYQNLKEGDRVILETPRGQVRVRLHTFEGIREGVVLMPLGFGHTAYDDFLRAKGVNANQILEARKDNISGLPLWWATPGRITKA